MLKSLTETIPGDQKEGHSKILLTDLVPEGWMLKLIIEAKVLCDCELSFCEQNKTDKA